MNVKSRCDGRGRNSAFQFGLVVTPVIVEIATSSSCDRVGIFTDESNPFRLSRRMRGSGAWEAAARASGTGRRTPRFPFGTGLGGPPHVPRRTIRRRKSGCSGPCVAMRFSGLKHSFAWPSGEGRHAGFVRQIEVLLRNGQRSPRVPDRRCDTFLKPKMTFPAIRAGAAAVQRTQ